MEKVCALLVGLIVFSSNAVADSYIATQINYSEIGIEGETFNPILAVVKIGTVMSKGPFQGVGFEAVAGASAKDVEEHNLILNVKQHWAGYVTFTNYAAQHPRITLYLGYASTEIDTELMLNGNEAKATLTGASYGVSVEDRFPGFTNTYWVLDCARYHDEVIKMSACGLGAKYAF